MKISLKLKAISLHKYSQQLQNRQIFINSFKSTNNPLTKQNFFDKFLNWLLNYSYIIKPSHKFFISQPKFYLIVTRMLKRNDFSNEVVIIISVTIIIIFSSCKSIMSWFDQQLVYTLPFTKIIQLLVIDQGIIMIIHHNLSYSVLRLVKNQIQLLSTGNLPPLSSNIQKFDRHSLIFLVENQLNVFNWIDRQITHRLPISFSQVYKNVFGYCMGKEYIALYKQSSLSQQELYTYDIDIYQKNGFTHVKKYKLQYPNIHHIFLINANENLQVVMYEIRGFTIKIKFLNQNKTQSIQSIFELTLIEETFRGQTLVLAFTHNELAPGCKVNYEITSQSMIKFYGSVLPYNTIVFSPNYRVIHPDLIKNYSNPSCQIKVRIKYSYILKSLVLLNAAMKSNHKKAIENGNTSQQTEERQQQQYISQGLAKYFIQMISPK